MKKIPPGGYRAVDRRKARYALHTVLHLEVPPRFELGNESFADSCLTTWPRYHIGAGDEARTRYLHLGKVALYRMSYTRIWCLRSESNQRHEDFQSSALPTELQRHVVQKDSAQMLL